ncbi:hypothetical protein [Geomonas ferrireducens]|uniref:hypothetical protein n=1 Tax=Geomonas ferrireducens TaxID=2570227 RepID=UPI0010A8871D|nr:hypothetical protein [Geomonas ferrireducens]
MPESGKIRLWLAALLAVALGAFLFLRMGEANIDHLTSASGILTMQECIACHSEGSTHPVAICLDDHCLYTNDHSLMHRYPPLGKEMEYASAAEVLAAGCILEDGKITCLSCHDLTQPAPHLIRAGDQLCGICHRLLR